MQIQYSKSTRGFYDSDVHANSEVPSDAVTISADAYWTLLEDQANGKAIVGDGSGNPVAVDPSSLLTVAEIQLAQINRLREACRATIESGFTSSAVGSSYTYPSGPTDQRNLADAMNASMVPDLASSWTTLLWCQSASANTWALSPHTARQVQQVHSDWIAFRVSQQMKLMNLTTQVNAAADGNTIAGLQW